MQQQTLGIVAPVPKGEWTSLANYQKLNIVRRNGASYMATAANTGIQPGVDPGWESYWMLLNEDGQGEEGAQGPAGPGVPTGGLQGEVLVKSSNTNYDTDWVPQSQIAAGSAENDGDGNNIVNTYETKSDATAKNTNLQNQITQNAQNIEQNAQIGSRNAKRLDGLEQRINPSPFVTDSTVAYQKDVPSNAVGAVEIQAIGGMTYRDEATNTLKNSLVTAVKSVWENITESALPIPVAVQALDGYDQGINATYNNHISWRDGGTKKTYNKMVQTAELDGTTTGAKVSGVYKSNTGLYYWVIHLSGLISMKNTAYCVSNIWNASIDKIAGTFFLDLAGSTPCITVYHSDQTIKTIESANKYLNDKYLAGDPVKVVYPLATPEVSDISSLITSDNLLPVQGNGVLIFENENSQAVPSTVEFITAEATA